MEIRTSPMASCSAIRNSPLEKFLPQSPVTVSQVLSQQWLLGEKTVSSLTRPWLKSLVCRPWWMVISAKLSIRDLFPSQAWFQRIVLPLTLFLSQLFTGWQRPPSPFTNLHGTFKQANEQSNKAFSREALISPCAKFLKVWSPGSWALGPPCPHLVWVP